MDSGVGLQLKIDISAGVVTSAYFLFHKRAYLILE